jgi:hypothetical protein
MKSRFYFRGFVSLLTAFSFIISLISGIVLYFTPQGKIANWTHWTFWGLDKHTWGALHINSSLVFFLVVIFHIYYNWKIIVRYLKKRAQMAINLKVELVIVTLISIFMVVASLHGYQPFGKIIQWNEDIQNYWARRANDQPPIPHAEDFTVVEFTNRLNISMEHFKERMQKHNWQYQKEQTIAQIAEKNEISPADIYRAMQDNKTTGGGWGRKTIRHVCDEYDLKVEVALKNLSDKNIKAGKNAYIRDIAEQYQLRPGQVVSLLTGRGNSRY